MTRILWDQVGERRYETGVDRGVLYIPNNGIYNKGYGWNGLTTVTESPEGAEANPQYADNIKYLNLLSAEEFNATIEAFTYPKEFEQCDGIVNPSDGVSIGQQPRKAFGLSYRSKIGTDVDSEAGYKLHLVYGALAAPSEKAYTTVNDSPEAMPFSWEVSTTGVAVAGYKNSAIITIDSTRVSASALAALELILYGDTAVDPRLPLPDEIISIFSGSALTAVAPDTPTFNASTGVITIPTTTGVDYRRGDNNQIVTGTYTIPTSGQRMVILATPKATYKIEKDADTTFSFKRT